MAFLLTIHSILRWLVVLLGLVVLIKFAVGWLRDMQFTAMDRGLASGFTGLLDLQVTLGVILLVWVGIAGSGFPRYQLEHAFTLIIAAVVAHLPLRWRESPDKIRFRNSLIAFLITLALIYAGVAVLPGNRWTF